MKTRRLFLLALALCGMVGLAGATGGCSTNPVTGEKELMLISKEQEIEIGNEAAPQFVEQFGGELPDAQLQEYVDQIGQRVAATSPREMPYEFSLLASKIPNAFALPGGKIYVTAGLMDIMDSEQELAAVLGHEAGHVAARHNVKGIQRQMGASLLIQLAAMAAGEEHAKAAELAAQVVTTMVSLRYSREQEYEADQLGIRFMEEAEYNPYGMVGLLSSLQEASGGEGSRLTEMFQTHPLTGKRIEEARETLQDDYASYTPPPAGSDSTFLAMRQRVRDFLATQPDEPEDESDKPEDEQNP